MGITQHLAAEVPDVTPDVPECDVFVNDGHGYLVLTSTHSLT